MKIESKKGTLYLGTIVAYNDKSIKIKDEEAVNAFPLVERAAEQLKKCHLKEGMFISLFVVNGFVENFKFNGRYSLVVERKKKDSDEIYTTRINVFIGVAASVTKREKCVSVSMPVKTKDNTDWYSLTFFYGSDEEHPVDLGEKAELELTPVEGEHKVCFWALTGAPRKYKDKNGNDRESFAVRNFSTFEYVR